MTKKKVFSFYIVFSLFSLFSYVHSQTPEGWPNSTAPRSSVEIEDEETAGVRFVTLYTNTILKYEREGIKLREINKHNSPCSVSADWEDRSIVAFHDDNSVILNECKALC